ncbi:MAG: hypothetical protein LBI67_10220 [Treponema sp.]|nr:hypothetical protein [Treponema sp.]
MKTEPGTGPLLFAVLVPHRNAVFALEQFRQRLFALGLDGAFSFPAAALLARLSRPLTGAELKEAAAELRRRLGGKKITAVLSSLSTVYFPQDKIRFFGPRIDIPPLPLPKSAVIARRGKPLLAPAVLGPEEPARAAKKTAEAPPPELSFRAAALSNLAVYPSETGETDYSYTWELGRLYWLPKPAR